MNTIQNSSLTVNVNTLGNKVILHHSTIMIQRRHPRLRNYLREYSENSSFHGCRYVGEKRTCFERILWVLILCTALGGSFYLIKGIYSKWKDNPVIVSFDTKDTPIFDIPFPGVTVCPETKSQQSMYSHSKMIQKLIEGEMLNDIELKKALYMSNLCDQNILDYLNSSDLNITKDFRKEIFALGRHFSSEFYSFIYNVSIDFFITNCNWIGQKTDCKELFHPIITDEGVCFSFNLFDLTDIYEDKVKYSSDGIRKEAPRVDSWNLKDGYLNVEDPNPYPRRALFAGAKSALSFELTTKKEDIDYTCKNAMQGFRISLHSPLQVPTPGQYYFNVPLDNTAVVGTLQPKMITTSDLVNLYKPESRGCYLPEEKNLPYFKIYNQMHCYMQCLNEFILDLHNCSLFWNPREEHICGASLRESLAMVEIFLKRKNLSGKGNATDFNLVGEEEKSKAPDCMCLPSCANLEYDVDTSHYDWKWREMSKLLTRKGKNMKFQDDEIYKSQVLLYFKNPEFVSSKRHELYGPTDFIANFGGLLGLFTGFSLLSMMELLYFVTIRVCCNIKLYGSWSGKQTGI